MAAALIGGHTTTDMETERRTGWATYVALSFCPSVSLSLLLCGCGGKSGQQLFDHVTVNVCQPEISSLKTISQFFVIESEQIKQRFGHPRLRLHMLREFQLRSVQAGVRPDERVIEVFDELLRHGLAVVFGE